MRKIFNRFFETLLATWLIAGSAQASSSAIRIDGKPAALARDSKRGLWISARCLQPQASCEALKKLPTLSLRRISDRLAGGANPGSILCQNSGGEVVTGVDPRGNENSFCRYPDGSLISSGTLHDQARKNDQNQKVGPT